MRFEVRDVPRRYAGFAARTQRVNGCPKAAPDRDGPAAAGDGRNAVEAACDQQSVGVHMSEPFVVAMLLMCIIARRATSVL